MYGRVDFVGDRKPGPRTSLESWCPPIAEDGRSARQPVREFDHAGGDMVLLMPQNVLLRRGLLAERSASSNSRQHNKIF